MLAGGDRLLEVALAQSRRRGVEIERVRRIGEGAVKIGRGARDAVPDGELRQLLGVAADEDRVRHDPRAVLQHGAALGADRQDRAHEMLVRPHPSGDAVHDDAETLLAHLHRSPLQLCRSLLLP
jgi:hypothetical protein